MATIEDILNPIERNAWFYVDINGEDADYYYEKEVPIDVYPYNICNYVFDRIEKEKAFYDRQTSSYKYITKTIHDNLKIKHYIKFGEECSICYEPIYSKPNAFLTDCGHCFHKTCISKWLISTSLEAGCPICRQDIGLFEFSRYASTKGLDGLEEFELNKDIRLPEYCGGYDDGKLHIMGIGKNCPDCIKWRK
jgi:hypothetical protein